MTVRIAIDCMGGDHGLAVTIPASLAFLHAVLAEPPSSGAGARGAGEGPGPATPDLGPIELLLVGRSAEVEAALATAGVKDGNGRDTLRRHLTIVHAEDVITMDDPPAISMRTKRRSSMRLAINLIKEGRADACVSAGNTGALMAISRFVLKTLEGIDRPAIATVLPNQKGGVTTMLDLGANVDCTAENLLQFAILGSALVAALEHRERPSVGLLNIGEELIKGNEVVKRAGELLRGSALNFHGNVEGDDIYKGTTDVVVCDGFVGNVAVKTTEGLAQMLGGFIKEEFTRTLFSRAAALVAMPVLQRFRRRVDPRRYNGASLLGLRGIVIKSHGAADVFGFECAIRRAWDQARNDVLARTIAAMRPFAAQPAAVAAAMIADAGDELVESARGAGAAVGARSGSATAV